MGSKGVYVVNTAINVIKFNRGAFYLSALCDCVTVHRTINMRFPIKFINVGPLIVAPNTAG